MTHTPGPWQIVCDAEIDGEPASFYVNAGGGTVAFVNTIGPADARLIASAPDLLKSLEAIIARVTGEFDATALEDFGPLSTWAADDILALARAAIAKATSTN